MGWAGWVGLSCLLLVSEGGAGWVECAEANTQLQAQMQGITTHSTTKQTTSRPHPHPPNTTPLVQTHRPQDGGAAGGGVRHHEGTG